MLDTVVLTGSAPDADSAEKIEEIAGIFSQRVVNHLRVSGTQQVLLRCTVAEVNRTATRQLGFNGWIAGDNAPSMFGLSNIGNVNPSSIGAVGGSLVSPRRRAARHGRSELCGPGALHDCRRRHSGDGLVDAESRVPRGADAGLHSGAA